MESTELTKLLQQQRLNFAGKTASDVYVSATDLNHLPERMNLQDVAPWTMIARVLLNLDETIARE